MHMEISYLGHSSFKIKTKTGTLVTDPYGSMTGLKMPSVSADVITVSHAHEDHNNVKAVSGTSRRKEPFVIDSPGEYEVEGVSVFGFSTFHDAQGGKERGDNTIYVIQAEDLRILHLGDLGHELTEKMIEEIDGIDIVMIPIGGFYTVDADKAIKIVESVDPYFVLPMHYRTAAHDEKTFGKVAELAKFTSAYAHTVKTVKSLNVTKLSLPQDITEVIVFE